MIGLREFWSLFKLEIRERLIPGERERNRLLLRSVYAAEHVTEGALETVKEIAWELNRRGYPEQGFAGIAGLATHAALAPQSEFGQRVFEMALDYVPNLKGSDLELYFDNVLAICVQIPAGSPHEEKAARVISDAYADYARIQPERAQRRLDGAIEWVAQNGALVKHMRGLLRAEALPRPDEHGARAGHRRDPDPS